ncbi:MAG: putative DNA-binding domain-containing protein, partial [Oceanicaulis sp.]|nr:putative DNA-binding domain-containing protein [Oceanicaulis sp.]
RNNVARGAVETLASAYPAVQRLVGERFFAAMAGAFRDVQPPRSPVLALYGDGFDSFIEQFEPANSLPYLPDIARLDRAWLLAHHAPDRPALEMRDITAAGNRALAGLRFGPHPASQILAFDLPAYSIWRTNREDRQVSRIRLADGAETALVWRQSGEVRHRKTSAGEHVLVNALFSGAAVEEACVAAHAIAPGSDPVSTVFTLIRAGVFERKSS